MSKPIFTVSTYRVRVAGLFAPSLPRTLLYRGDIYTLSVRYYDLRVEVSYKDSEKLYGLYLLELPQPEVTSVCVEAPTLRGAVVKMSERLKTLQKWQTNP